MQNQAGEGERDGKEEVKEKERNIDIAFRVLPF